MSRLASSLRALAILVMAVTMPTCLIVSTQETLACEDGWSEGRASDPKLNPWRLVNMESKEVRQEFRRLVGTTPDKSLAATLGDMFNAKLHQINDTFLDRVRDSYENYQERKATIFGEYRDSIERLYDTFGHNPDKKHLKIFNAKLEQINSTFQKRIRDLMLHSRERLEMLEMRYIERVDAFEHRLDDLVEHWKHHHNKPPISPCS